jgi:hypothetical protein
MTKYLFFNLDEPNIKLTNLSYQHVVKKSTYYYLCSVNI